VKTHTDADCCINSLSSFLIMYSLLLSIITLLAAASSCTGFAPVHSSSAVKTLVSSTTHNNLHALPIDNMIDVVNNIGDMSTSSDTAAIGMMASSSSMLLSETEAWVQPLSFVLGKVRDCVVLFCVMVCSICMKTRPFDTSFELSLPL